MTKYTVKYRFSLGPSTKTHQSMRIYGKKWGSLVKRCTSTRHLPADYDDLPHLRKIAEKVQVADLAPVLLQYAKSEMRMLILDCTPLFNTAPRDLKAFILLAAGIRSHHFQGEVTP